MSKRAERRHHLSRMKAKAIRIFPTLDPKQAIKWANHLKMCSCQGCCNPRRSGYIKNEVTRQECLAYVKYLEGIGSERKVKHCRYRKAGQDETEYRADTRGSCDDGPWAT